MYCGLSHASPHLPCFDRVKPILLTNGVAPPPPTKIVYAAYTGPQALGSVVLRAMSAANDPLSSNLPLSDWLPWSMIVIFPGLIESPPSRLGTSRRCITTMLLM